MSTNPSDVQSPVTQYPGLINTSTTAKSILSEQRDRRAEPEDNRTRRFGYNPGFQMMMDPRISGLQRYLIDAGVLILFETGPVMRQNPSVDAEDNSPPAIESELLAGEGLGAILQQNAHMGFRELLPLRGLTDEKAVELFYYVHPPLHEAVESKVIKPCPYDLEVCITCRLNVLNAIQASVPEQLKALYAGLRESVTVGRSYMAAQWREWTGEVAGVVQGTNRKLALGSLTDGHLFFMYQLHERTPNEAELAKIAANAEAQAKVLEEALARQTNNFTLLLEQRGADNSEVAQLREEMTAMREEVARLRGEVATTPPTEELK